MSNGVSQESILFGIRIDTGNLIFIILDCSEAIVPTSIKKSNEGNFFNRKYY